MRYWRHLAVTFAGISALFLMFPEMAYADIDVGTLMRGAYPYYIDPGTGSIIIQVLVGAFIAGLGMVGVYRTRVKDFLTSLFTRRRQDKEREESE